MPHEYVTISKVAAGLTIETPEGKPVQARLSRAQRRNIARLLYRAKKPPKVDPVEIGHQVAYRNEMRAMRQRLIDDRAALEAAEEAAYMTAAKLR